MNFSRVVVAIGFAVLTGCAGQGSMTSATASSPEERSSSARLTAADGGALLEAAQTNLVADGSFETPAVPAGNLTRFSVGQALGPWTVVGPSNGNVDVLSSTFMYGGYTFHAKAGKQQLDLTGASQVATGVAATLKTVQGHGYTLTFYVGNVIDPGGNLGTSSTVHVLLNGRKLFTGTNSKGNNMMTPVWEKFSVKFKAPSAASKISFINGDPSNDTYNGLDDIVLAAS